MTPAKEKQVILMAGTRKGALLFTSDSQRQHWQASDLQFKSWNVMHLILDPRDRRLHAAVTHVVYGASTHFSDDLGRTWTQASQPPVFTRPSKSGRPIGTPGEAQDEEAARSAPEKVLKVWAIAPARPSQPGLLFAGIEPGALFQSTDRGQSWDLNESLYDHPHRANWFPGAGGLGLHTILLDPLDDQRMYVALSAGGCYRSEDGGRSWHPRNKNVRADFMPDPFPEYGHCVHRMAIHPGQPEVLFQQNHCGVYRSDNRGDDWIDIGENVLPSRFGFPIAVHPHDPHTIYVVLEESDEYRVSLGGQFAVWRSRDGGGSWERLTNGLPKRAHLVVLRQALALDSLPEAGVYVGTTTGQIFFSPDGGDHWRLLADYLPPVLSLEVAVLD